MFKFKGLERELSEIEGIELFSLFFLNVTENIIIYV